MAELYYHTRVWSNETSEYERHRIPGMIVTKAGTILIYNEARRTGSDWAMMDIFLQRSEDGGKSFGERIYLARGTEKYHTVNNPVMAQDHDGRIHFLHCEDYSVNGGRVLYRYSDDDGITWSEPRDITDATLPGYRNAFALGPGHGTCTKDGTLLFPIWMVPKAYERAMHDHGPSVISVLYSKDRGETWQMGDIMRGSPDAPTPNETTVAETSDGRVYLNARIGAKYRASAWSDNGYCHYSTLTGDHSLTDPICFGSTAAYHYNGKHAILFANCDTDKARDHVTVRVSCDDGRTFPVKKLIDETRGGYVEIAVNNDTGVIYVLYEEQAGVNCWLTACDLDWLTE